MSTETFTKSPFMGVSAPERLTQEHDLSAFDCDKSSLNGFLKERALENTATKATITYVVCRPGTKQVVGYFSVCPGGVDRNELPGKYKKNMPSMVPVIILARLAIDNSIKGNGVGQDLLQAALLMAIESSYHMGAVGMMVNAADDAIDFYLKHDFDAFPKDPSKLITSLKLE